MYEFSTWKSNTWSICWTTLIELFTFTCRLTSRPPFHTHKVWDWDPETQENKLLIDVDPLVLANDPALHQLLDSLKGEEAVGRVKGGHYATFKSILNWTGFLILKTLEIAVEVLA